MQLVIIPLFTGYLLSRALADPVLSFTLQNNPAAFAMTDRQKIEGADKVGRGGGCVNRTTCRAWLLKVAAPAQPEP